MSNKIGKDARKHSLQILDQHHEWPCLYQFKFIIPAQSEEDFLVFLSIKRDSYKRTPSRTNKYLSISLTLEMKSAEEVIKYYEKAKKFPGLMAL